jgi:hypothetical protein
MSCVMVFQIFLLFSINIVRINNSCCSVNTQYQSCYPQCEMPAICPHADYWYSVLKVNYRLWPQYSEGSVTGIRYVPCFMGLSQSALRLTTGWEVWGSNPGGVRDFLYPARPALGPKQHPIQWVLRFIPGGKAAGAWRWPSTPSRADFKERVER